MAEDIQPSKKYLFKQLETGLKAFVGTLELRLQEIIPDIPVLILNTGDDSYFLDAKFKKAEQEIYQKVPRFVIEIGDATPQTEQDSSQFVPIIYNLNSVNYTAIGRRKALSFEISGNLVASNYLKALEYEEVMLSIFVRDNAFTYEWLGNTYEASFAMENISVEKNSTDVGSTSKNNVAKVQISLTLQPFIIRYESIRVTDELPNQIQIQVNVVRDSNIEHSTSIKPNEVELRKLRRLENE